MSVDAQTTTPVKVGSDGNMYFGSANADNTNSYDIRFGAGPDWGLERYQGGLNFFKINNGTSCIDYRLFLKDNGNMGVGIGNNPQEKLHVNGRIKAESGFTTSAKSYMDAVEFGGGRLCLQPPVV